MKSNLKHKVNNGDVCRVCGSKKLKMFLDLGFQPWCNDFVFKNPKKVKKYPLKIYFCQDCTTVQVGYTVSKEIMFNDHLYLSGTTKTMNDHFSLIADQVIDQFKLTSDSLIFDIGSNDGTLLSKFKSKGFNVLGVDPCKKASLIANKSGIKTINSFFNKNLAQKIKKNYGLANIISAANVFYHTEELHSICEGIKNLLAPKGVFVIQGSYLPEVIKKNEFDIMYHEHLLLYRMETLDYLLRLHNLSLFDVNLYPVHGGSFVAFAIHLDGRSRSDRLVKLISLEKKGDFDKFKIYLDFAKQVKKIRINLICLVSDLVKKGKIIYGYGAPAKGTVLINYCHFDKEVIPLAVEKNGLKFNHYIPGTKIKIIDETKVKKPDYYLLLAWNFAEEILKKFNNQTHFIVPFPNPFITKGLKRKLNISVVIKCKDDYRVFDCIKSIDEDVEVIVSLTPNKQLETDLFKLGVKYVISPVGNLSVTANNGIKETTNNKVIIMDSDTTFAPGCIYDLYTALDLYQVARPKIVYLEDKNKPITGIIGKARAYVNEYPLTYAPGLAFKKTIRDKIGGYLFDNDIPWAEDDDLSQRIFNAGLRVVFLDSSAVFHSPISLKHDLQTAYRIGTGVKIATKKNNRNVPENPINWFWRLITGKQIKELIDISKTKGFSVVIYSIIWSLFYYFGFYKKVNETKV